MAPTGIPSLRLYGFPFSSFSHESTSQSSTSASSAVPQPTPISSSDTSNSTFSYPTTDMPPPGPSHYEARRALWLAQPSPARPRPSSPSTSRAKLEALLSREDAITSDEVWDSGLRSVWKGLVGGGQLRRRLPLSMVIKILLAGWIRDETWPADAIIGPPSPILEPESSNPSNQAWPRAPEPLQDDKVDTLDAEDSNALRY